MVDFDFSNNIDMAKLKAPKVPTVYVGFPANLQHSNSRTGQTMSTAELARKNSFGWVENINGKAVQVPPRPFLEPGMIFGMDDIRKAAERVPEAFFTDGNMDEALDMVGVACMNSIKRYVTESGEIKGLAPNSALTIEEKGSDTPLVDEGGMIGALTFVVAR